MRFDEHLAVAKTMFLAKSIQKKYPTPADLALILQASEELGITYKEADGGLYYTKDGSIGMRGDLAMSLVVKSGLMKTWDVKEVDNLICSPEGVWEGSYSITIKSERKGGITATATYSDEDAKRAGLWVSSQTSVSTQEAVSFWYKNPKRMCQYKAKGMIIRDLYPDIIGSVPIIEEHESFDAPKDRTLNKKAGVIMQKITEG